MNRLFHLLAAFLLLTGCGAHVAPSVPDKPLPQAFAGHEGNVGGESSATVPWREWFADERLSALISEALANNQDLQIALQRVQMARSAVTSTTGALLPRVDATVGGGVRKFGLFTMDGAGNATTDIAPGQPVPIHLPDFTVGLQSAWELDVWGRLRSQRQSAISQYLASEEGARFVRTSLIAELASAYYDLLALDHTRQVLQKAVKRQRQALEVVRIQKEAGRSSELAIQQFEAQLAETEATQRATTQQLFEAENRVNLLLGRYPQAIDRQSDALFAEVPQKVSAGLPSALLRQRPDVREAELQLVASQFDLKAARAAFFPDVNLSATVGLQAFNPAFLVRLPESIAYSVLGGLVAPLVNRTAIEAQFQSSEANQIAAMHQYQRAVLVAYVEVVNALSNARNTQALLALRRRQKAALEEAISTADILYRAGKATYLEVLLTQQNALQAELQLVEASKQRRTALVTVYRSLGGGTL